MLGCKKTFVVFLKKKIGPLEVLGRKEVAWMAAAECTTRLPTLMLGSFWDRYGVNWRVRLWESRHFLKIKEFWAFRFRENENLLNFLQKA